MIIVGSIVFLASAEINSETCSSLEFHRVEYSTITNSLHGSSQELQCVHFTDQDRVDCAILCQKEGCGLFGLHAGQCILCHVEDVQPGSSSDMDWIVEFDLFVDPLVMMSLTQEVTTMAAVDNTVLPPATSTTISPMSAEPTTEAPTTSKLNIIETVCG